MPRTVVLVVLLVWASVAASAQGQGFTPQESVKRMTVAEGFQVTLVANEPEIRQPLSMTFDARGRLWVIQYLQYPTPAGLKPVAVDQFLRTKYDRVPEPPPKGPKGADRITILEDPDQTGRYRKVKDFVGGLNLATGLAIGHGGVFVVQPPYLLFYPDKNGDDIPDGDPEVLLIGFGMEDSHAFANHLRWGPDGWLYGAQGSTVTANIRGIEFQQGIWRYRPPLASQGASPSPPTPSPTALPRGARGEMAGGEFELFSEGGGNTWGLDFDRTGQVIAGTNWGGKAMLHQVQGGYYIKGFGKHGPLHNPYTFGYFDHIPHEKFKGGHVTCGGSVYQGGAFPEAFHNTYIAANPLAHSVYWHTLERKGSSFTARYAGDFLLGNDTWFRPIDCVVGPDGAVYIADWYDKRINHVDPVDNWDRTNGRIYRVECTTPHPHPRPLRGPHKGGGEKDLTKLSSKQLVELLSHPNAWQRREARRLLGERRDASVIPALRALVRDHKDPLALEALWALYVSGGFDEATAEALLEHASEDVRAWTIRLLGDPPVPPLARGGKGGVSASTQGKLVGIARGDPSSTVRSQLACTSKRLPAKEGLPIVRALLQRQEDLDDVHIPLLLWWAIEDKASSDRDLVLGLLDSAEAWRTPLVSKHIVERLARRYMAEGNEAGLTSCSRLLAAAPGAAETKLLVEGMEKALEGRRLQQVPAALEKPLADLWQKQSSDLTVVRFALRLGSTQAYDRALQMVGDARAPESGRTGLIEVLGQMGKPECVPVLLQVLRAAKGDALRMTALSALQAFPEPSIATTILELYPKMSGSLRGRAQTLLCSRPAAAQQFLLAVDAGRIPPKEVPLDQLRQVLLHNKEDLNRLIEKHWGKIGKPPAGETQARIRSVQHILNQGKGDLKGDPVKGKALYEKNCAVCHQLFGAGNKIGPDLTGADRKNTAFMVANIVDPSAVIRPEFVAHTVETNDGRVLTGLIVESSPKAVTLLDGKNERTIIARDKIDELKASPISLMPDKILDPLDDQQIRDFFAYLQSEGGDGAKPQGAQPVGLAAPLKVCLVSGSVEYKSDESLSALQNYLEKNYHVKCTRAFRKTDDDLPGLDNLESCDVMLLFTRRLQISGEQLERVRKYCKSGKPIVGVRTASHAFQKWLELDKEVLGGNYKGHLQGSDKGGPICEVQIVDKVKDHPILAGVKPFKSVGGLYKNTGIASDVEILMNGSIPEHVEPLAWTRLYQGGRIFYTSLGHPKDFEEESFQRLLANALFWTCQRGVEKK